MPRMPLQKARQLAETSAAPRLEMLEMPTMLGVGGAAGGARSGHSRTSPLGQHQHPERSGHANQSGCAFTRAGVGSS